MKLKTGSKHKFDTTAFLPSQAMRGTIKQSKLLNMTQNVDLSQALQTLQIAPKPSEAKK